MMMSVFVRLVATLTLVLAAHAAASAQTVTAAWDANTDPATAGYRLYYGTTSGAYTTNVDVGNVVSRQVTLSPGATYYFVVRAYNAQNQLGPASTEVSVTMAAPPPPPVPTAVITATLGANNVATVNWQTTNATTARINGQTVALSGSAQYPVSANTTFQLVATGTGGSATASASVVVPVVNCVTSNWTFQSATAWGACTNGQRSRTETWTRTIVTPASGGGAACGPLQEQRVATESCSSPAPTATINATLGANNVATVTWQTGNATSATLDGAPVALSGTRQVTVSATTTFRLVATGPGGTVTRTATVNVTPAPTATITATRNGSNTATVQWQTTNATSVTINGQARALSGTRSYTINATTTFRIVATGPGGTASASATVTIPAVDCVTSAWALDKTTEWGACTGGQQTRTETWVRTILTPASGGGAACGALTEQRVAARPCSDPRPVAPGMPTSLAVSTAGSEATLTWGVPATGGAPTGYRVWVGTTPNRADVMNGGDVGNALRAKGRLPRGTYYARVAAYNPVGVGPMSATVSFQVGATVRPGKPRGFTASLQQSLAVLAWQAPAGDDANAPTTYVVEAGSAPGLSNLARVVVGQTSSFQAAVPAGIYYVRVRAINELGAGDASEELVLRHVPELGVPTGLSAAGEGATVVLTWSAPATGDAPAGYVVEAGSAPGLANIAVLRLADVTRFATTVPAGEYHVRVRAVTADGLAGDASNEIVIRR